MSKSLTGEEKKALRSSFTRHPRRIPTRHLEHKTLYGGPASPKTETRYLTTQSTGFPRFSQARNPKPHPNPSPLTPLNAHSHGSPTAPTRAAPHAQARGRGGSVQKQNQGIVRLTDPLKTNMCPSIRLFMTICSICLSIRLNAPTTPYSHGSPTAPTHAAPNAQARGRGGSVQEQNQGIVRLTEPQETNMCPSIRLFMSIYSICLSIRLNAPPTPHSHGSPRAPTRAAPNAQARGRGGSVQKQHQGIVRLTDPLKINLCPSIRLFISIYSICLSIRLNAPPTPYSHGSPTAPTRGAAPNAQARGRGRGIQKQNQGIVRATGGSKGGDTEVLARTLAPHHHQPPWRRRGGLVLNQKS